MDHDYFMGFALELSRKTAARSNLPCGAVIVRDGKIVGEGANTVNSDGDPTAHAEVMALRSAARSSTRTNETMCRAMILREPIG